MTSLPVARITFLDGVSGARLKNYMASPEDIESFNRLRLDVAGTASLIPKFPAYPEDVKKRFPSLAKHEELIEAWRVRANIGLKGGVETQ